MRDVEYILSLIAGVSGGSNTRCPTQNALSYTYKITMSFINSIMKLFFDLAGLEKDSRVEMRYGVKTD